MGSEHKEQSHAHIQVYGVFVETTDHEQHRLEGGDGERGSVVTSFRFTGLTETNFKTQGPANVSQMHKILLLLLK